MRVEMLTASEEATPLAASAVVKAKSSYPLRAVPPTEKRSGSSLPPTEKRSGSSLNAEGRGRWWWLGRSPTGEGTLCGDGSASIEGDRTLGLPGVLGALIVRPRAAWKSARARWAGGGFVPGGAKGG